MLNDFDLLSSCDGSRIILKGNTKSLMIIKIANSVIKLIVKYV